MATLTPDKDYYEPGEPITLTLVTTNDRKKTSLETWVATDGSESAAANVTVIDPGILEDPLNLNWVASGAPDDGFTRTITGTVPVPPTPAV